MKCVVYVLAALLVALGLFGPWRLMTPVSFWHRCVVVALTAFVSLNCIAIASAAVIIVSDDEDQ